MWEWTLTVGRSVEGLRDGLQHGRVDGAGFEDEAVGAAPELEVAELRGFGDVLAGFDDADAGRHVAHADRDERHEA